MRVSESTPEIPFERQVTTTKLAKNNRKRRCHPVVVLLSKHGSQESVSCRSVNSSCCCHMFVSTQNEHQISPEPGDSLHEIKAQRKTSKQRNSVTNPVLRRHCFEFVKDTVAMTLKITHRQNQTSLAPWKQKNKDQSTQKSQWRDSGLVCTECVTRCFF